MELVALEVSDTSVQMEALGTPARIEIRPEAGVAEPAEAMAATAVQDFLGVSLRAGRGAHLVSPVNLATGGLRPEQAAAVAVAVVTATVREAPAYPATLPAVTVELAAVAATAAVAVALVDMARFFPRQQQAVSTSKAAKGAMVEVHGSSVISVAMVAMVALESSSPLQD